MTTYLSPLTRPPRGGVCQRCKELIEGLARWMWTTEPRSAYPVHGKCTTLQEWNEALSLGLRPPTHNETGPVGPVGFEFVWADYEEQSSGTPTRDETEFAERGLGDPFTMIDWGPDDDEELEADQSEALAA